LNQAQQELLEELGYIEPKKRGGVPSRAKTKKAEPKPHQKPAVKFDNVSVKTVTPLTYSQKQFFESFSRGYHIVADGSAGTGKTYIATYLALKELFNRRVDKIIFLRSVVATRDMGFLPGNIVEKSMPFWALYQDHVNALCENGTAWDILYKNGAVEFETTSFMRGKTWNNAIIIMDEIQNLNRKEVYTALTRVGKDSRVIICGDHKQTDLMKKEESWEYLKRLIERTDDLFDTVTFTNSDIVRSEFVKQIIIADSEIL
jgi:phosphate starvation-inducible PhoH-like protein